MVKARAIQVCGFPARFVDFDFSSENENGTFGAVSFPGLPRDKNHPSQTLIRNQCRAYKSKKGNSPNGFFIRSSVLNFFFLRGNGGPNGKCHFVFTLLYPCGIKHYGVPVGVGVGVGVEAFFFLSLIFSKGFE